MSSARPEPCWARLLGRAQPEPRWARLLGRNDTVLEVTARRPLGCTKLLTVDDAVLEVVATVVGWSAMSRARSLNLRSSLSSWSSGGAATWLAESLSPSMSWSPLFLVATQMKASLTRLSRSSRGPCGWRNRLTPPCCDRCSRLVAAHLKASLTRSSLSLGEHPSRRSQLNGEGLDPNRTGHNSWGEMAPWRDDRASRG